MKLNEKIITLIGIDYIYNIYKENVIKYKKKSPHTFSLFDLRYDSIYITFLGPDSHNIKRFK